MIPAAEVGWASRELGFRQHAALVSPLIEHVEVEGAAGIVEKLELLSFISRIL